MINKMCWVTEPIHNRICRSLGNMDFTDINEYFSYIFKILCKINALISNIQH